MKITDFSVKNYQFTLIVFVMLSALGISSLLNMPKAEDPEVNAPQFTVVAIYPGTSPRDMEQLVVKPIERRFNEMDDVKRIRSTIDDGLAVTQIEFQIRDGPRQKIPGRGPRAQCHSRRTAERFDQPRYPAFQRPSDVNILQVALLSETAPYRDLEKWSKGIERTGWKK
jgi:multidrug efflux pump subunit AcrB